MHNLRIPLRISLFAVFVLLLLSFTFAHDGAHDPSPSSHDAFVRVTQADPQTRTYTFNCVAEHNSNDYLYDFFVRPDNGDASENMPNEFNQNDLAASQNFTYTFQQNMYYHIGCVGVHRQDFTNQVRGDLHIDLRTGPWNIEINPQATSFSSVHLTCASNQPTNSYHWEVIDASAGTNQNLGTGQTLDHAVARPGLYDYLCFAHMPSGTKSIAYPIEFFTDHNPYFATTQGVPYGVTHSWANTPSPNQPNPNPAPNGSNNNPPANQSGNQCYNSVQTIPTTCEGGSFTTDNWDGCRTLVCTSANSNSMKVLACDKSSKFEMYKQSQQGNAVTKVCIGNACISDGGFASSGTFPICMNSEPVNPPAQPPANNSNNNPPIQQCYNSLEALPASCQNGGQITSDVNNGCRQITCADQQSNPPSSLSIMACSKPDRGTKTHFEMYLVNKQGSSQTICLGSVCFASNDGYKQSPNFPICVAGSGSGNNSSPPVNNPPANQSNTPPNQCTSFQDLAWSCEGGSISNVVNGGCRQARCAVLNAQGQSNPQLYVQALACAKPDQGTATSYELYLTEATTQSVDLCLGKACVGKYTGFSKENLCQQNPQTMNNQSNQNPGSATTPTFYSPSQGSRAVSPTFFHVEFSPNDGLATDVEIWDQQSPQHLIWSAYNKQGISREHMHTADGQFANAGRTQLEYDTTYQVRARSQGADNALSAWSEWIVFTTSAQTQGYASMAWNLSSGYSVEEVSSDLDFPVNVAPAPQQLYQHLAPEHRPFLYVTELYGNIKVIFPDGSHRTYAQDLLNFDPFGSITGGGQMGVTGLYVDQNTGDLYVGMVYMQDSNTTKNKLIKFDTDASGTGYNSMSTLFNNVPAAPSHQIQQIARGPDNLLYVGMGDGNMAAQSQNWSSYVGKILRLRDDGTQLEVYAKGLRNPFGIAWHPTLNKLYGTDNAPDTNDRLLQINQGQNYGWGEPTLNTFHQQRIATLDKSPVAVAFNPPGVDTSFPAVAGGMSKLYVAVAGPIYQEGPTQGKYIREFTLNDQGAIVSSQDLLYYTGQGYSTPIGMTFATGGLYFTDIYGPDGITGLGESDGKIYRVKYGESADCAGCQEQSRVHLTVAPWYPKRNGNNMEYIFNCEALGGSGSYSYKYELGDGDVAYSNWPRQYHQYPYQDRTYHVTCTVTDQNSGTVLSDSLDINPVNFIEG